MIQPHARFWQGLLLFHHTTLNHFLLVFSGQAAALKALTQGCKYAEGRIVIIYTDSRYAFGVAHDFGTLWKHRQFRTSTGKPFAHYQLVAALLDAILLPEQIAICKCEAHANTSDPVSQRNARADVAAKEAATLPLISPQLVSTSLTVVLTPSADLQESQIRATQVGKVLWKKSNACFRNGVWYGPDDKP